MKPIRVVRLGLLLVLNYLVHLGLAYRDSSTDLSSFYLTRVGETALYPQRSASTGLGLPARGSLIKNFSIFCLVRRIE